MAQKTNSLERFWKELKRRNLITVYAATAFIILELVNMVARPLQLPYWTEAFVIVLLGGGGGGGGGTAGVTCIRIWLIRIIEIDTKSSYI